MAKNVCILLATVLCTVYYAQASNDVNIMANVFYPGTFTNEFAFTKPVKCVTNPPGRVVQCLASKSQPQAEEIEVKTYTSLRSFEGWRSYVSFFGGREKTS